MSQGPLCPNLTKKVQKEVSQMANRNLSYVILLGGLSVNLNRLKSRSCCILAIASSVNLHFSIVVCVFEPFSVVSAKDRKHRN